MSAAASLFSRRLLIVTGKGGVGKTSLAAALGVAAARRELKTIVVEVGPEAAIPQLLAGAGPSPPEGDGREPVPISPHLYTLRIDPAVALSEYLELQVRVRPLVRLVVGNPGFQRLLEAAPGWRELITLGKLWHLESQREGTEPRWGLLIVDAPATGHGLSLLSVPSVVIDTVRMGPLRRHTDWVQKLIRDPVRTLALPATLPEELPVKETEELIGRLEELGVARGPVLANGIEPVPELPELGPLFAALGDARVGDLPPTSELRAIADHAVRRSRLQRIFLDQLRDNHEKVLELPLLDGGIEDRDGVERLADALDDQLERLGELE